MEAKAGSDDHKRKADTAFPERSVKQRTKTCTTLYVGNLSYDITQEILRKLFSKYGDIKAVRLAEDIKTKKFRGFGYVQFYDANSCEKAMECNGKLVIGRALHLDYADANDAIICKERLELERKLKKGRCHKYQNG